ncbi:MAG: class I SAM-dependent RNA methyltransferase [Firmicutes bacterium]|nr:class I SAM-dependent RNA methyltransferase [Bacillota bacterium]
MIKGQTVSFKIEDMSLEGQGLGRTEGVVVFVPGAVPGDVVEAEITKVKKNYCFSRLVDVKEPSPDRETEFDCPGYEKGCGGCIYGELSYGGQLALKERQVREKIARLGGVADPVVRQIIGMEEEDNEGNGEFRYRNKAQFPVSTGGIITRKGGIVENLGEPAVGFYRQKSHTVVDCPDCYIQSAPAMAAADALRRFMAEDNITAWDPKWEKGLMRHLIVKTGFTTGEVMVILVINGKGIPNVQKLIEMMDDAIYQVGYSLESVAINVNKDAKSPEIMGEDTTIIAGSPVITDVISGLTFEISPTSFYQINPVQVEKL